MAAPLHQLLPPEAIIFQQLPLQGSCLGCAGGQSGEKCSDTERQKDLETETQLEPEMCHQCSEPGPDATPTPCPEPKTLSFLIHRAHR